METLENRRLLAADFEPNDTTAEAVDLGSGNQTHLDPTISVADQSDWYKWRASSSGSARVEILFNHAQADLALTLHSAAGTEIARSDGITDNERVAIPINAGTDVFIQASSCSNPLGNCDNGSFSDYTLKITEVKADSLDGGSGNDSMTSATDFGSNNQSRSNLTIHDFGDEDYFRFAAPTDGVLNAGILFSHNEGDLDLFAYDAFGELVVSSQSETDDEQLSLNVSQGDEYFLQVLEVNGIEHPGYDLNVNFVSPPIISGLPGIVSGFVGAPTTIPFTVTDGDDPIDSLVFSGSSNDPSTVPDSGITFGGSGGNRTVTIDPDNFGVNTEITIVVNDLRGGIAEAQFRFSQFRRPVTDPPFISPIDPRTTAEDTSTGPISFVVSDDTTAIRGIILTASSSDTTLIPTGNISINKSTPSSSINVTPAANRVGTALITIVAEDRDGVQSRTSFPVTVTPVNDPGSNDPPTFNLIPDQSINEDSGQTSIAISGVNPGGSGEGGQTVTLSAASDNPLLVNASISGTTLRLSPGANRTGTARITVQAQDNGGGVDTYKQSFVVVVNDVNDSPTLSNLSDDSIAQGSTQSDIDFTVNDVETPPSLLLITTSSSNTSLIPNSNVAVIGSGPDRTVIATPVAGQTGSTSITVTVSDGDESVSDTYLVSVVSTNDPPNVSGVVDQTVNEDTNTPQLSFTVGDEETDLSDLIVSVDSSNPSLIPNSNLTLVGSGGIRTLDITPVANASGTSMITITVQDTGTPPLTVKDTFQVTVRSVNDSPAFVPGGNQAVLENAGAQTVTGWATNLSAGPANESTQTLAFDVTTDKPSLFFVPPVVSPAGDLTFSPAFDSIGKATVTVRLTDDGGTAFGGTDTSTAATFTITVGSVNDQPSFTKGGDQTAAEDSGLQSISNWANNISPGPSNESNQNVTFEIASNSDTALFGNQPAVSPTGTLTYEPAANANGTATISLQLVDDAGTTNGGNDTSELETFTITVTPVNDRPTFVVGPDQSVEENADVQTISSWATSISPGPADELGQQLTFSVEDNSNAALFSAGPAIDSNGQLSFTPATDASGSALVSVVLADDGGGNNKSIVKTFSITVGTVNDPPSFSKGPDQTVFEDAGEQKVPNWATNVSAGPDELDQSVVFEFLDNSNPDLFASPPAISPSGELTYTPVPNANGAAIIGVRLRDNGGTDNNGNDVSPTMVFEINVLPVNDAPGFTKGPDLTFQEGAGDQVVSRWAQVIDAGQPDEADQLVQFTVLSNDNPTMFSVLPMIFSNGTLTFTPADGASGTATIGIRVFDDGGTENGGVDVSPPQTFTITATSVNNEPSFVKGPDQTAIEDSGSLTVPGWATSVNAGGVGETGQSLAFHVTSNTNPSLFDVQPAIAPDGDLTYAVASDAFGVAAITVQLVDDGGTSGGGNDTSASQTFTVNITPVNDAPTFESGENVQLREDTGAVSLPGWADTISAGPGEADQSLTFNITANSLPSLFDVQPTLSGDGTLSFTVKPETFGSATLATVLVDNGGTVNGGVDTSPVQSFVINVIEDNDLPVISAISDQTIEVGGSKTMNFTVGDAETAASDLTITTTTSNPDIIPPQNINVGGTAGNRTIQITVGSVSGSSTVGVNVNDGEVTTSELFEVTVVDNASPFVIAGERNDGAGTFDTVSSLSFTFNENVGATIDRADLVLIDSIMGTQPNLGLTSVVYDIESNTARFDLSQVDLPKGRYLASLRGISDANGNNLDGNQDGNGGDDFVEILVLTYAGDANLDLKVDFDDFLILANSFGQSASWISGDFDGNGLVEFADFLMLSANFGKELLPANGRAFVGNFVTSSQTAALAATSSVDSAFSDSGEEDNWWENGQN